MGVDTLIHTESLEVAIVDITSSKVQASQWVSPNPAQTMVDPTQTRPDPIKPRPPKQPQLFMSRD